MASPLSEVDEIRRHMAQIRHELHEDVQGVVKGAEAATDWRRFVKNYPWVTLGIAFGIGYFIVPRRQRPMSLPTAAVEQVRAAVAEPARLAEPAPKKKGKGLVKIALGFAAPFVLRTAQGYALQFFEQFLAQKMAQQQSPFADLAASFLNNGTNPQANGAKPTSPSSPR